MKSSLSVALSQSTDNIEDVQVDGRNFGGGVGHPSSVHFRGGNFGFAGDDTSADDAHADDARTTGKRISSGGNVEGGAATFEGGAATSSDPLDDDIGMSGTSHDVFEKEYGASDGVSPGARGASLRIQDGDPIGGADGDPIGGAGVPEKVYLCLTRPHRFRTRR